MCFLSVLFLSFVLFLLFAKRQREKVLNVGQSIQYISSVVENSQTKQTQIKMPNDSVYEFIGVALPAILHMQDMSNISHDNLIALFCFVKHDGNYSITSQMMGKWYPSRGWDLPSTIVKIGETSKKLINSPLFQNFSTPCKNMANLYDASCWLPKAEELCIETVPIPKAVANSRDKILEEQLKNI